MKIGTQLKRFTIEFGEEQGCSYLAQAGFDCLDFNLSTYCSYQSIRENKITGLFAKSRDEVAEHFAGIRKIIDRAGLTVGQVHAPVPSYIDNTEGDSRLVDIMRKSIDAAHELGSRYIVIHPSFDGTKRRFDRYAAETKAINTEFYRKLIPTLKETGVKVGIENMWARDDSGKICPTVCSTPEEMCDFVDTFNRIAGEECFVACLDIGHSNLTGQTPAHMISVLGDRLKMLHVHDNDGVGDLHTAPFLGNIDWDAVCRALKSVGYSGSFSFEADEFYRNFTKETLPNGARVLYSIGRLLVDKYGL
jgi:sugar phosphate isomerase/epimerase